MKKEKKNDLKIVQGLKANSELVKEKELAFDAINSALITKKYPLNLDTEATEGLLEFFDNIQWKGYESYGIEKMYDTLIPDLTETSSDEDGTLFELKTEVSPDIVEAVFYFIKNYTDKGIYTARAFRKMADAFAEPMQQINVDRQALRDAALELQAAEQGMTMDELTAAAESTCEA